eukprot:scaffold91_cov127-Cylindrotheca_fusiformis.AAC.30
MSSLGGGPARGALRDASSRYNSFKHRRRQSLGGSSDGGETPVKCRARGLLGDPVNFREGSASSIRSSSTPRRSIGGDTVQNGTPIRDRRAMLENWRKARAARHQGADDMEERKRTRGDPLLPPTSSRKIQRIMLSSQEYEDMAFSQGSNASTSVQYFDDEENSRSGSAFRSSRTPRGRRGNLGSARRHSLMGRNLMNSTEEPSMSQLTIDSDAETFRSDLVDTVEGAGFQSQMDRMRQRLEELEKEKMDLSMSKAPLEARFRQKEESWGKEKSRLLHEIESSKSALREADEKFRDLQVQYDQAYDECIQLRQEVRKASSSRPTSTDNSLWSRQLQNDRDLADMKEKLRSADEEIKSILLAKVSLEKELHATRIELDCLERNFDELKNEYEEIATHTSENKEAEIKLQVLTEEHMATSAALNAVYADLDATKARADAAMVEKNEEHKREIEQLNFDLSVMKTRASKVQVDMDTSLLAADDEDEAVLRARIEERDKRIVELEAQLLKGEQIRRQMHNCIQELRGNIRVYVRTRPFLPGDRQTTDSPIDVSPDGESLAIMDRRSGSALDFKFDKIFPPSAGQEVVFDEVSDFVQSALDGYHVCLFSYGQTGSGKTHTMQGCGNGTMRGIIPRAVEQILSQARTLNKQKWKFTISASFLEIYNENLKDLLVSMGLGASAKSGKSKPLAIKRDREGKSFVQGLTSVPIEVEESSMGMEQLETLMGIAARARSVASTKMNSQSSRSHSVFMLHLNGFNEDSGAIVNGALNLCDLAGSERLDRSGAGADAARLKETQSINKSLSCLGDVFNALSTGASHVPYRNSKLTYLLQDCLSGDGKALMFVNLSPTTASSGESVCSLRFAQRVNQVELGKATKHVEFTKKGKR